jgi:Arc/MetJ-type ribon-helix-helix transcriptional regulator
MTIKLNEDAQRLIDAQLRSGRYESAEHVVLAALATLAQQPGIDFAPGELHRLIEEGEESIRREGTLDGEEAFKARRQRRQLKSKIA